VKRGEERERERERYRKIRSPAHEWPPLSGRSEIAWRDSYLFPTEVDWNIFYRVGPHPRILLPFPELPPGAALSRRAETREHRKRELGGFFMGKMAALTLGQVAETSRG
jgi:hypothetical protein